MVKLSIVAILLSITFQRLYELRRAEANRTYAMQHGGREFGKEHYWMFFVLHSTWMLSWSIESYFVGGIYSASLVFFGVVLATQIARMHILKTLGQAWNTRIIIIPNTQRVKTGLYKYVNHPNYIIVAVEIFCVPMIFGAWRSALVFTIFNAILLLFIRIPSENAALAELQQ